MNESPWMDNYYSECAEMSYLVMYKMIHEIGFKQQLDNYSKGMSDAALIFNRYQMLMVSIKKLCFARSCYYAYVRILDFHCT